MENHEYPIPRVEKKNREYAELLMQDYAGKVSEDTAVHLYFYQHMLHEGKNEELANALREIAITEMHHLSLLGETIKLLGGDPIFYTKDAGTETYIPWTASNVNYEKELKKQIELDIESETLAIRNYQIHRDLIDDKYIKEMLTYIIGDERKHLEIFYSFYYNL